MPLEHVVSRENGLAGQDGLDEPSKDSCTGTARQRRIPDLAIPQASGLDAFPDAFRV